MLSVLTNDKSKTTFYPTPVEIADKMLNGIEWGSIKTVLEPSAGKGDLAKAIKDKNIVTRYGKFDTKVDIDCIEIDENLRHILIGNGLRVVHDDFMTFKTFKRYDAIIMNPPFDCGADHLLKAIEMQERGGVVVCLLNAQTLKNDCYYNRQKLNRLLKQYNANIEYIQNGFSNAERKTDVEIAIVTLNIPKQTKDSFIVEGLKEAAKRKEKQQEKSYDVVKSDFIEAIVDRYNFEVELGCKLIDEYDSASKYFGRDFTEKPMYNNLSLIIANPAERNSIRANYNDFVEVTRRKYWSELFTNSNFMKGMTSNLREELMSSLDELVHYDFSMYNIMEIVIKMNKKLFSGINDTIMKLFDDWTFKYSWRNDYSKNKHYFDGWKTNDCFAVNKKVIAPNIGSAWDSYGSYCTYSPNSWSIREKLEDIEKVFDYLSGNLTKDTTVMDILNDAKKNNESKCLKMKYFTVTFYKKGTCHIEFTDTDVLKKFNLYAAKQKNWLPPCYGKKTYKEMDKEERSVVDSFEGKESYEDVMSRAEYFLSQPMQNEIKFLN